MAGLLGDSWDDPRTMAALQMASGLLASGGPSRQPQNLGVGLLGGLQQYQGVMDNARRQKMLEQQMQMQQDDFGLRKQEFGLREQERQTVIAEKQRLTQIAQQRDQYLAGLAAGNPLNPAEAFRFGITPEHAKSLVESGNWGRPVVRTWKQVRGPNGVVEIGLDEYGQPVQGAQQTPFIKPDMLNLGDRQMAIDPTQVQPGQQFGMGVSPDTRFSAGVTMRGQNMTDARAREQNAQPKFADGAWMYPPTAQNPQGGMVRTPAFAPPKNSPEALAQSSSRTLAVIDEADRLLESGATGSYIGAGVDQVGKAFGLSTKGADNAARLKALEGAIVMAQPRMEGPQSDKDTQLYRQMAAQIGDSTVPTDTKRAALATIREIHQRYAGGGAPSAPEQSDPLGIR